REAPALPGARAAMPAASQTRIRKRIFMADLPGRGDRRRAAPPISKVPATLFVAHLARRDREHPEGDAELDAGAVAGEGERDVALGDDARLGRLPGARGGAPRDVGAEDRIGWHLADSMTTGKVPAKCRPTPRNRRR